MKYDLNILYPTRKIIYFRLTLKYLLVIIHNVIYYLLTIT